MAVIRDRLQGAWRFLVGVSWLGCSSYLILKFVKDARLQAVLAVPVWFIFFVLVERKRKRVLSLDEVIFWGSLMIAVLVGFLFRPPDLVVAITAIGLLLLGMWLKDRYFWWY